MKRRAKALVSAVLMGLTAAAPNLVGADESLAPEEAVQGHGKLGTAAVELPLDPADLERRLAAKGMRIGSPIFIRIFKSEAELELWVEVNGRFELFAVYPICNWSGNLGPKLSEGDKQSPEGLYVVGPRQLRHSVRWRRALDLGFPNTFDRAFRRTGSDVLLHGGCTSTGCYAMTDPVIEEIFRLSRAALADAQKRIHVHALPFRMTAGNLAGYAGSEWHQFWSNLKDAYDIFERTRRPPAVSVCNSRYVVGATAVADDDDDCDENVSAVNLRRGRIVHSRAKRSAVKAYAAARRARLAAGVRHRQALHASSQRRLAK